MKNMFHRERPVAVAAWGIYFISFFLPAFDRMPGWKAAILQKLFLPQALEGQWIFIHYLLLTFANLLMVVSPLLLAWAARDSRLLYWLRGFSGGAAVLVWSFILVLVGNRGGGDLRVGCYLWASSFVLLFVASLVLRKAGAGIQTA